MNKNQLRGRSSYTRTNFRENKLYNYDECINHYTSSKINDIGIRQTKTQMSWTELIPSLRTGRTWDIVLPLMSGTLRWSPSEGTE